MGKLVAGIYFCFLLAGCKDGKVEDSKILKDSHSYSMPGEAIVKHLELQLEVDFNNRRLTGQASWIIANPGSADSIILDTRQMEITRITTGDDDRETKFTLSADMPVLGRRLAVALPEGTKKINIFYQTLPEAAALQWLDPQQTSGKQKPFLFTQSQAILARTWIPCQDGPAVRFTYNATVTVPADLIALMSAVNPQVKNEKGVYSFKQENPIPSYLMALAVGDIGFKAIDSRSGVYAEPVVLEKSAWELADMGKMITEAEKLYGRYKWGRYDLLVLPPSFPFGGMENPMLTFATPTIIAGDRSLVSLVAHELAHSWSGNLVTNATWNDFWLNEGFTTYFERRIVEAVYGVEEREMLEVLGYNDLVNAVHELGDTNADTRLKINLYGRDPDLGVSDIAYEKGYLFLKNIEQVAGRKRFDRLLAEYFNAHQFRSVTTEEFLSYLNDHLIAGNDSLRSLINAENWINKPGIPKKLPVIRSVKFIKIDSLINTLKKQGIKGLESAITSTNEKLYFLRHLPGSLSLLQMKELDKEFGFTSSYNSEIQCAWYILAIRHNYRDAYPKIEFFLTNVGRRKFLMPIYGELIKTPEGKQLAKTIYAKARPNYHSVAFNSIDALLK